MTDERAPTPPASAVEELVGYKRPMGMILSVKDQDALYDKALDLARRLDEARKERDAIKRIGARAQDRAEELQRRLNTAWLAIDEKHEQLRAAEQLVLELEAKPTWDKMIADLRAVVAELPANRAAAPGAEEGK